MDHGPATRMRMRDAAREVPLDHGVVALRHSEPGPRAATAAVPGITEGDGARRYIPALEELEATQAARAGGLEGR